MLNSLTRLRVGTVAGCCVDGNELPGSINIGTFPEELCDCLPLKKESAAELNYLLESCLIHCLYLCPDG